MADNPYAIVTTPEGAEQMAKLFAGLSGVPAPYLALGTGTTKPAVGDGRTALENEVFRGYATITQNGGNLVFSITVSKGTFQSDTAITELAIYTAESGGIMCVRGTRAPVVVGKDVGATLTFPYNFIGGYTEVAA